MTSFYVTGPEGNAEAEACWCKRVVLSLSLSLPFSRALTQSTAWTQPVSEIRAIRETFDATERHDVYFHRLFRALTARQSTTRIDETDGSVSVRAYFEKF